MASIARRADGRWRARYRDAAGKELARHFERKVDAQAWLDSVTTAVGTGTYVDPGRAKATVGELAPVWLAGKINLKPTSRARYADVLRRLMWLIYATSRSARQTRSRVCAAMVAAVRVSRPQ